MRLALRSLLAAALLTVSQSPWTAAGSTTLHVTAETASSTSARPPLQPPTETDSSRHSTPVVVELFTSEGCADCPPADVLLQKLIDGQPVAGAAVIALGEHVDYWDQLGWKDRFSSATLTNRQHVYGAHFNLESVYTPQMIVDGSTQLVGSDGKGAVSAIARALASPHAVVRIDADEDARPRRGEGTSVAVRVSVDRSRVPRGERAEVVVAITEDRLRTEVARGENHGRTLTHAAVVRSMTTVGQAAAGDTLLRADVPIGAGWNRDALNVVAFVQEQRGRAILGAAAVALRTLGR
jgi:hypothetical protein